MPPDDDGAAQDESVLATLDPWLAEHWDPARSLRDWWADLGDAGWAAPSWPVQWCGRGLAPAQAALAEHRIAEHGAVPGPAGFGVGLVGPTILAHGDDDQRARHLPPMVTGALAWCQLFSEPGAGSDLAGLQTRAVRDGDSWVVTGQKVWTSAGQIADWAMLLARTDVDVPKHSGISYFLIDMHQPGVEVRPLREMTGRSFFNEVFLTEARVSARDLVGGAGNGWAVANTTLAFERAGATASGPERHARPGTVAGDLDRPAGELVPGGHQDDDRRSIPVSERLAALARARGHRTSGMRSRLAELAALERIGELTARRARDGGASGPGRTGAPNLAKMAQNRMLRLQRDLTFGALGADGMRFDYRPEAGGDAEGDPEAHAAVAAALFAQAPQIYGGSDQIQHNIVGDRALGLPREPRDDRSVPFRDLPKNG